MKMLLLAAALFTTMAYAEKAVLYPTMPDGTRDYRKATVVIDGDVAYKTVPITGERDYRQPSYKIKTNGSQEHKGDRANRR